MKKTREERLKNLKVAICNAQLNLLNNVAYAYMRENPWDKRPWEIREEKEIEGEIIEIKLLEQK